MRRPHIITNGTPFNYSNAVQPSYHKHKNIFCCFEGELVLVSSLDHETTPSYGLVIAVSDGGIDGDNVLSASAIVYVTVLDVNEFSPQFHNGTVYKVAVQEEATHDNITTVIIEKYTCVGQQYLCGLVSSTKHTHPRTHV